MKVLLFLLGVFACAIHTFGQIRLPRLISNGMVLERDAHVRLWGWANANEKVSLTFMDKIHSAVTNNAGQWSIDLPPQPAGGPYVMKLSGSNEIVISDIRFGDVWVCSGQSNMELTMDRVKNTYGKVISEVNNPDIREFLVPDSYDFQGEHTDVSQGAWKAADQTHILSFSAVGYFFAAELYKKYHVPIGLINAALGGSPADAWISESALKQFPASYAELQHIKRPGVVDSIETSNKRISQKWYSTLDSLDAGINGHWSAENIDVSSWDEMNVPGYWAGTQLGNVNGTVWFRKELYPPESLTKNAASLLLGRIVDADSVFVNGEFVGATSYQYPPRKYLVRRGLIHKGKNVICIRVINTSGRGGFVLDKPYAIVSGNDSIDLRGTWKFKAGALTMSLPAQAVVRWKPAGLYNAMIAPIFNYKIKGAIWYQGESNTSAPEIYEAYMTALISDWRKRWESPALPFIFVQLANFMEVKPMPSESNWARLRMAQLNTLSVPKTGMAIAIDLGEWNDIHPVKKMEVGRRLALQAVRIAYGDKNIVAGGPLLKSVRRKDNALEVSFADLGTGLTSLHGDTLRQFAVAGKDGKYVWANAIIRNSKVIVTSPSIPHPVSVRYAWADNPEGANLYNLEGLPASPFEAKVERP